jgi:hypothetical protein
MSDFNEEHFTFGSIAAVEGIIGLVAATAVSPADIVDGQRLRDHAIMHARAARARSHLARRRALATLDDMDAGAALRRAARRYIL